MPSRILIADDEPNIREVISFALSRAGFATQTARNGVEALQSFRRQAPDLVILDIGMPDMDGLEVCRQLRRSSDVPILFLSARSEEIDRVLGLELGGDDYVTKPFSPRELVARVNAILKRARGGPLRGATLSHSGLALDPVRHHASYNDQPVALTAIEFAILEAMLTHPDVVYDRSRLVAAAYGVNHHISDRTVDSHIRNIRAKFAAVGCDTVIATVHGVGFKIGLSEDAKS